MLNEYTINNISIHNKINDCWIVIDNRVYDLTKYLEEHPGGINIIMKYAGKDATEAFENINHSKNAYKLLNKYVIGIVKDTKVDIIQNIDNKNNYLKLVSKEDKIGNIYHLHKLLGVICLIHFLYRFIKCLLNNKKDNFESGFSSSIYSVILILFHLLLSFSSLIFHIPKIQTNKPMIWDEFRAHNITFATRSIICFLIGWISLHNSKIKKNQKFLKGIVIILTLYIADIISKKFKDNDKESTTRTMPYWDNCPYNLEYAFKNYYMIAQFQATFACLSNELFPCFAVIFPIQFASFLMTLVRKNIICTKTYHITYLISLLIPYLLLFNKNTEYKFNTGIMILIVPIIIGILRTKFNINKYTIWIPIIIFSFSNSLNLSIISLIVCLILFKNTKRININYISHKNQKKDVKLISKYKITHDTWKLKFKIPEDKMLGLKLGEHILIYYNNPSNGIWNNLEDLEDVMIIKRKYTPINDKLGYFELVIKEYKSNKQFSNGGKISQILCNLKIGEIIKISGPYGNVNYLGNNKFKVINDLVYSNNINIICAGSGITPFLRLIFYMLKENNNLFIKLLYVNKTYDDIILRKKLDKLKYKYKKKLEIKYCCTREDEKLIKNGKIHYNTRPDYNILNNYYDLKIDSIYLLCGPSNFINTINMILLDNKINSDKIIIF